MNNHEARIRNFLADNICLIEKGLTLIGKEYPVGSDHGAGGFIDILANDRFGHHVVIEIKRSNQVARAALHELTKYTALLKSSLGIPTERIRAILLSTEWHELAVPFSEYLKTVEVPTEGYALVADEIGVVNEIVPFCPIRLDVPLRVERAQFMWLFAASKERDNSINRIAKASISAGVDDFAILSIDYVGNNDEVIHPHGAYFAFSSPIAGMDEAQRKSFIGGKAWDDELDDPIENILGWVVDKACVARDEFGVGFPEKLLNMQRSGWRATVAHRNGRYGANTKLLTEAALIAEVNRIEGGAAYYLIRTVSPKYSPSWKSFKQDVNLVFLGSSFWLHKVSELLEKIEQEQPRSTVSMHAYNQADLIRAIAMLANNGDERYTPRFQLVAQGPDNVTLYFGELAWNGEHISNSAQSFLARLFGDPYKYFIVGSMHEHHHFFEDACTMLGIKCVIIAVVQPGAADEETTLYVSPDRHRDSGILRHYSLADFVKKNRSFCNELVAYLVSKSHGFFPSDQPSPGSDPGA